MIEDDDTIGSLLESGLRANGYEVRWCKTGSDGIGAAGDQAYDLIVLDLGLPDIAGEDVCRQLRLLSAQSIIVILTAKSDEMDVVVGLESGADDYLTKPFGLVELLARVRAHLRRSSNALPATSSAVTIGVLSIDFKSRQATLADAPIALRAKEFDLLARLVLDAGTALNRETLMNDVWDENWFGSTKTLDVHMAALRRKLEHASASLTVELLPLVPEIATLRGHGYRLELPQRAGSS